jgi:hypothetical protein
VTTTLPKTGTYRFTIRAKNGPVVTPWSSPSGSVVYSRR